MNKRTKERWFREFLARIPAHAESRGKVAPPSKPKPNIEMEISKSETSATKRRKAKRRPEWEIVRRGGLCTKCRRTHVPLFVSRKRFLCSYCLDKISGKKAKDALDVAIRAGAFDSNRRRH